MGCERLTYKKKSFSENTLLKIRYRKEKKRIGVYQYVYNYTDHLGNIRMSYTLDQKTLLPVKLEETHYYPFGLKHSKYNDAKKKLSIMQDPNIDLSGGKKVTAVPSTDGAYNYKYNGKELQDELGLNWYDLGARNHDPATGRFYNIDPKAEQYSFQSPFAFANNNPVFYIDFNGEGVEDDFVFDENGDFVRIDENESPDQIVIENQTTCEETGRYNFNDTVNDTQSIRDGIITGIVIISEDDISNAMWENGTNQLVEKNANIIEKTNYINTESTKGGDMKLDHYKSSSYVKDGKLHLVSQASTNVGYNDKDFGNFLWGRAGATLGFDLKTLRIAAHVNNMINGKSDNPGLDTGIWDAVEDQRAIIRGYSYPNSRPKAVSPYLYSGMY